MGPYDLIGDVHGHLELLRSLGDKLGYSYKGGFFEHPKGRKLIFVGDLVNRGPDSVGVLEIVRKTWEEGNALLTLGNHEFRLIQLTLRKKDLPDEKYRPFLSWIKEIPLFLELEKIRVVHAAWHNSSISLLAANPVPNDSLVRATLTPGSPERMAVDRILKGVKATLPKSPPLFDRFGENRKKGRLRWWEDLTGKPFSKVLFPPMYGQSIHEYPSSEEINQVEPYPVDAKPVFFGHYCLRPQYKKINANVACLDGCVTCDKKLWAYRCGSGNTLSAESLVCVEY